VLGLSSTSRDRPASRWSVGRTGGRGRTVGLFILGIGFFMGGGVVSIASTLSLLQTRDEADHSRELLAELADLRAAVNEVAATSRGYALTGRNSQADQFSGGTPAVFVHLQHLTLLTADDAAQQARLPALRGLLTREVDGAMKLVEARRNGSQVPATFASTASVDAATIDTIGAQLAAMASAENARLAVRRETVRRQTFEALAIEVALGLLSALILGLVIRRMLAERKALAAAQESSMMAQEELAASIAAVEGRTAELTILSELSSVLGMCLTLEEFHAAVATTLTRAVPSASGALGIIDHSRSLIEVPVSWGDPRPELPPYNPDSCCALRSGRAFRAGSGPRAIGCNHGGVASAPGSLCVPLSAQGDTIGVLHLWAPASLDLGLHETLVLSIAEHLAMALANLTAHEALRQQATRDPLTGAFNRRFMLEVLERELLRARRPQRQVGVLMLDVDHFKQFNDTYGHQAGDEVLQLVVQHIRASVRVEDFVCRYGGEEFAVILPEASVSVAAERAEEIRALIAAASHRREGGAVTVSIGVAVHPDHGDDSHALIKRADEALYRAKRSGRNRVETVSQGADTPAAA
jgi:diguanylate cyclase (GGDEF)-like protein